MHLLRPYSYRLTLTGIALALLCVAIPGRAEPVPATQGGPAGAAAAADPSKLQVSYANQKFSIEADHADVQSALKSIFSNAKLQFACKSNVAGQLTLRLTDQPLETVLKTICAQTLLRYQHDAATDVYIFEQDTDAIKDTFTRLRSLNAEMRQQLRNQGLEVPGEEAFKGAFGGPGGPAGQPMSKQQNPGQPNGLSRPRAVPDNKGDQGLQGEPGPAGPERSVKIPLSNGNVSDTLNLLSPNSQKPLTDKQQELYLQFLRQNNLVTINTQGQVIPVSDVFAELQRQSNIAILLDPDIPRGQKFRMQLTLPATALVDALNLLCPALHLNWRRLNNAIFVTPTSDFQIFWGNSNAPRVIYGVPQQSQRGGFQNNGQGGLGGGQTPPGGRNPNP